MAAPQKRLPLTVWALGLVSFCTDLASEMIVPLLPAFLAGLGAGPIALGLLQGSSDAVVALLRALSGWLSDRQRRKKPWIVAGYAISSLLRPLMALVQSPLQALLVRAGDRLGKGLRSAPRDALIADVVASGQRGAAFGLQRAMDHAGALAGTLLGFLLLSTGSGHREIFAWAALPGALAVAALVVLVRERPPAADVAAADPTGRAGDLRALWPFLGVVFCSAFGSVIDLFLLQRALELGIPLAHAPLLWAVLHLVRSTLAAPLGRLSDRLGRRRVIAGGLAAQFAVLLVFGMVRESWSWAVWPLFAAHGLHAAFSEGAERGFVADLTRAGRRGTVFGIYHACSGLSAFVAAVAIGVLWDRVGAMAALHTAAAAAIVGAGLLLTIVAAPRRD